VRWHSYPGAGEEEAGDEVDEHRAATLIDRAGDRRARRAAS
jgi:hypothetical protein